MNEKDSWEYCARCGIRFAMGDVTRVIRKNKKLIRLHGQCYKKEMDGVKTPRPKNLVYCMWCGRRIEEKQKRIDKDMHGRPAHLHTHCHQEILEELMDD